jgi:hypothetical protein
MTDYWKKAGIAGSAGLVLAISLAYGIDISKEGIALIVAGGLLEGLVGLKWKILYFLLNLAFFVVGTFLSYKEVEKLLEEEWQYITISILSFLSIFLIYLGMAMKSDIQNFGAYLLVIDILFLAFCRD